MDDKDTPVEQQDYVGELVAAEVEAAGVTPFTRRIIIYVLGFLALACIIAEVVLAALGEQTSDAIMTVAATAVGGIAGLAIPDRD